MNQKKYQCQLTINRISGEWVEEFTHETFWADGR